MSALQCRALRQKCSTDGYFGCERKILPTDLDFKDGGTLQPCMPSFPKRNLKNQKRPLMPNVSICIFSLNRTL